MIRLAFFLLLCCGMLSAGLAAEAARLELNQDALEDLPQEERLAFIDAQKPLLAERWKAAALGFHGFCSTYPESILWVHAAWLEAFAQLRCGQNNSAIERLSEIIHASPKAPEMPEVLLLQGECWQGQGDFVRAQKIFQELIAAYPATSAALVARVQVDKCTTLLGQQQNSKPEQLEAARLAALSPLATMSGGIHDGSALRDGLNQLSELYFSRGRFNDVLLMARSTVAANPHDLPDFKPQLFADEIRRRVCLSTLESGDDLLFKQVAKETWPEAKIYAVQVATLRCDFYCTILQDEKSRTDLSKRRKMTPAALISVAHEALANVADEALASAVTLPSGPSREQMTWLAVRAMQVSGRSDAAPRSIKALSDGLGRDLRADDAGQFVAWGLAAGLSAASVHGIVDHVPEGLARSLALFAVLTQETQPRQPLELRKIAAEQAVALATTLADELPERQGEFLSMQGRLYEDPLGDFNAAIVVYTKLDQPPGTEFAIVRCFEQLTKYNEAFQRLGTLYATNATNSIGATALLKQGFMAHQNLHDRPRAVALLRQVCDEFPDSAQYSEAHVYLQSHLDVTYTGGGGQRNK